MIRTGRRRSDAVRRKPAHINPGICDSVLLSTQILRHNTKRTQKSVPARILDLLTEQNHAAMPAFPHDLCSERAQPECHYLCGGGAGFEIELHFRVGELCEQLSSEKRN